MMTLKLCRLNCPDLIPPHLGEELGDGADGQVFAIENDPEKVLKFSVLFDYNGAGELDRKYKTIARVLSYLHSNPSPTYAHVYAYQYMGKWSRKEDGTDYILHYYAMERLQKLTADERKVFHSILSHEDRNIVKYYSSEALKETLRGLSKGLDFDLEKVILFYDNFKKTPIKHSDIHPRNIMKDASGNFKLIDFDQATLEK